MPKTWIYFLAVLLLLAFHVLVMDTRFFLDWLWYSGHETHYHLLNAVSTNEQVIELFGGWPLPVFVVTVLYYWIDRHDEEDNISGQFLLLPLFYVPFLIVGNAIVDLSFDPATLYMYPVVVIPAGYLYVLPWAAFVWVFSKLRLVV